MLKRFCWTKKHFLDISYRNFQFETNSKISQKVNFHKTSNLCQFLEIHAIRMPFNVCKECCWFSGRFVTLLITWWRWYLICVKIRKFAPTWRQRFLPAQNTPKITKFQNEGLITLSKFKMYIFSEKKTKFWWYKRKWVKMKMLKI